MDLNNSQNQSYWFVLREDPKNVVFSSNNLPLQNPQYDAEPKYELDINNRQYVQVTHTVKIPTQVTEVEVSDSQREDFWNRDNIKYLLNLTNGDKLGNIHKEKDVWTKIGTLLNTTPEECAKKYRILRNIYIRLTKKKQSGRDIKWIYYNICEEFFKDSKYLPSTVFELWDEAKTRRLLSLYIENLHKFQNPDGLHKDIWKKIAGELGTTWYNCYQRYRILKKTYNRYLQKDRETGLKKIVKWQYYNYFSRICSGNNPVRWTVHKIRLLLNCYLQRVHQFRNPSLQKKDLWREISAIVGENASMCDKKFRNLKKTYLTVKFKLDTGKGNTKWIYYKYFEMIENAVNQDQHNNFDTLMNRFPEENITKRLLTFYIENKEKFNKCVKKKKHIWKIVAPELGMTAAACDRKFRNLKQTYLRLADKKQITGQYSRWPYFVYFQHIYSDTNYNRENKSQPDDSVMSEIRRVVEEVQDKRDIDRQFDRLAQAAEESNNIQKERNAILKALIDGVKQK